MPGAPPGSVAVAADGSVAAFVPARRAVSWQLTDAAGTPVVRERYWITMQPGEVRVCGSCHGVNTKDQAQRAAPTNAPQAFRQLLAYWASELDTGGPAPAPVTLTVTRTGNGAGTVSSSPAGIACGTTCEKAMPAGELDTVPAPAPVTLTVTRTGNGAGPPVSSSDAQ